MQNRKNFAPSGFTIIEVALVLAIAGMIFLVVFLALPALQRSQRDTARRQDVAKAVAAIQQYYADGGDGSGMPSYTCGDGNHKIADDDSPLGPYLRSAGLSPNITFVRVLKMSGCTFTFSDTNILEITVGDKCGAKRPAGGYDLVMDGSPYVMAVVTRLEAGAQGATVSSGANIICQTATR